MEEIEVKFLVRDSKTVADKLRKLGFRIAVGRHREKNYLFDDPSGSLQKQGKLLRLRKTPSAQTITYKGPISAGSKLKHREEIETRIDDPLVFQRIFREIGYTVTTEYSKYRTVFGKGEFTISLDETEAGTYLEVEGPSDEEITDLAQKLGYSEADFIRQTYAELIGERRDHEK
jgi:predicted adenylyl cyclase CyaB